MSQCVSVYQDRALAVGETFPKGARRETIGIANRCIHFGIDLLQAISGRGSVGEDSEGQPRLPDWLGTAGTVQSPLGA